MKRLKQSHQCLFGTALIIAALVVMSSCSSNNEVASRGTWQKRKYRSGFHLNGLSKKKELQAKIEAEQPNEAPKEYALEAPLRASRPDSAAAAEPLAMEQLAPAEEKKRKRKTRQREERQDPRWLSLSPRMNSREDAINIPDGLDLLKAEKDGELDEERLDKFATYGFALGVGNILSFAGVPLVGIAMGVIAIVLGVRALKTQVDSTRLMAILAIIFGFVSLIMSLLIHLYYLFFILAFTGAIATL